MARALLIMALGLAFASGGPTANGGSSRVASAATKTERRKLARKLFVEGHRLYNLRQFARALAKFRRAYQVLPLPGFLYNIAQCHRFLGSCKRALFFYAAYLRENPGAPNTQIVKRLAGECQRKLKQTEKRRQEARRLFASASKKFRLGEIRAALALYKRAYKAFPHPGYLFRAGVCHQQLGEYIKAIRFYRGYLQDNPGTPETKQVEARIAACRRLDAARRRRLLRPRAKGPISPTGVPRRPAARRTPLYRKWWFWLTVGVAAAAIAGGVTAGVLVSRRSGGSFELPSTVLGTEDWRR